MKQNNSKNYTTDSKVIHYSKDEDINNKLSKIIGNKFSEYRKVWDKAMKMELVTDYPLFLHLDMNQECNYKCPHCIIGNPEEVKEQYEGEYMNFDEYKMIIDEAAEHGCPSMSPQGNNEPFLIKKMHEYIYYASKKGIMDIMLNCNGSAITKKKAKQILDSGLTRMRFSLDAFSQETYEKVRVGSIPLKRVIKNIETFLNEKEKNNYKLPIVGVSFCKLSQNEHEIEPFFDFWKDRVDIVTFQRFVPPLPNVEKYSKYYCSDQFVNVEPDKFNCIQPFQRIVIRNKSITPCCTTFNKNLTLGTIDKMTVREAWHSKKMNDLREIHRTGDYKSNTTCKKCVDVIYPKK